jgi:hypothetical protein
LLSWFCYLYPVTTCLQHKRSKVSRSILQSSLKALARFLILKCRLFVFRFLTDVRSLKAVLLGAAVTSSGNLFLFSSALTENEYILGSILANWTASPCPLLPSVSSILEFYVMSALLQDRKKFFVILAFYSHLNGLFFKTFFSP